MHPMATFSGALPSHCSGPYSDNFFLALAVHDIKEHWHAEGILLQLTFYRVYRQDIYSLIF